MIGFDVNILFISNLEQCLVRGIIFYYFVLTIYYLSFFRFNKNNFIKYIDIYNRIFIFNYLNNFKINIKNIFLYIISKTILSLFIFFFFYQNFSFIF